MDEPTAAPDPAAVRVDRLPTWARRSVVGLVLVVALGLLVWGAQSSGVGSRTPLNEAIVNLTPLDGAQVPRQVTVGADLQPGYDGRLTVNGIAVPEEQMIGARDPSLVDPQDLAENGVRPNNKNAVFFRPGPGKVIEAFETGPVTITLRYYKEGREQTTSETVSWTVQVI